MSSRIPTVVIMGPTGVGKTRLSVAIAKAVNGEVISVDSIQVYRDCPIMAAQVAEHEMEEIPHHLVDYLEAAEEPTPATFIRDALAIMQKIHSRGRVPVICGGSTSLMKPLMFHPFMRAQNVLPVALTADLSIVQGLCDARIGQMLQDGLLREVERMADLEKQLGLYDEPIRRGAWRCIGYPELRGWWEAAREGNRDEAASALERGTELMRQNTVGYAEMQLRLLWDDLIPTSEKVYGDCVVLNVVSRQRFSEDVEQPAILRCKQWLLNFRQGFLFKMPVVGAGPAKESLDAVQS